MPIRHFLPLALALSISASAAFAVLPQTSNTNKTPASAKKSEPATPDQTQDDEGERIFEQNCSRCHNAPQGFSPRISGTIVRHMRVRASLSKHDEEALLHFLNP